MPDPYRAVEVFMFAFLILAALSCGGSSDSTREELAPPRLSEPETFSCVDGAPSSTISAREGVPFVEECFVFLEEGVDYGGCSPVLDWEKETRTGLLSVPCDVNADHVVIRWLE
jgi:hypothetical protein